MKDFISSKILFVEDDPNLSMILQDYLEMIGFRVDHAKDGEEGFHFFKRSRYDLLILDIMMPKKDGFTLADDIRKINTKVPILFLTHIFYLYVPILIQSKKIDKNNRKAYIS